jgi:hypothetical protein
VTEAQTIDAAERALMAETLRGLAGELDGTELVHALDAFGFADLLAEAPRDAVSALFTALGRAGSMSTSLQDVLLQPLAEYLPAPRTECNVLLPGIGADLVGATDGEALTVRGLVIGARTAPTYLAPVAIQGELAWIGLEGFSGIFTRRVEGLDPALAMIEVTGVDVAADVVVAGEPAVAAWNAVATAGRLALGYQILGAVGQMIDLAVDHARSRVQFGRPSGHFKRYAIALPTRTSHGRRRCALAGAWDADDAVLAGLLAKSLAGVRRGSPPRNASKCWPASVSPRASLPPVPGPRAGAGLGAGFGGRLPAVIGAR